MLHFLKYILFILTLFFFSNGMSLETEWSRDKESQLRLISPVSHNNNTEIYLGLEYRMQEGWKTYWQSPGDGGFPQKINWSNSKNIKSLEIEWPVPKKFEILGIKSLGYENKVIFPLKLGIINPLEPSLVILDVNYLVCKDICIPGNVSLDLLIPSGQSMLTKHSYKIEKSLSSIPIKLINMSFIKEAEVDLYTENKKIHFSLSAKTDKIFKKPNVFLHTKHGLPVINPLIKINSNSKNLDATFTFDKKLIKDSDVLIKFVIQDKNDSFVIQKLRTIKEKKTITNNNKFIILLIAFIGGLILNAMPCVFPVLSIKILSMLKHIDTTTSIQKRISIQKSFLLTSLGIITSFVILAVSFMLLRYFGVGIGWGMQFQQPSFLMIVVIILVFFILNLLGFFELVVPNFINTPIISSLNSHYYLKDFFNGFFATIMATPCSAPFVGTAITAAFTQSFIMMFFIFLFMSFGMSFPYLVVSFFPNLLNFFPKPGKWMIYLKYALGIMLLGTLIWIGNILLSHFNYYFILSSIGLLIITFLIIYYAKIKKITLIVSIIIFFTFPYFVFFKSNYIQEKSDWLSFNSINIENLINEGNIIFIDITADWCATCQYNKINVLNTKVIKKAFDEFNVIKIRGDWTKPNNKIQKFLEKNRKYGIPFNIIYNKNNTNGVILSELLSENEIIKILNSLYND